MKINNVIIDECVSNEIKFFVENNEDGSERWFSWSFVFEEVLKFKFKKGYYYIWLNMERMGMVENVKEGNDEWLKSMEEDFGERFYEDDKLVLVGGEDGIVVWVKKV